MSLSCTLLLLMAATANAQQGGEGQSKGAEAVDLSAPPEQLVRSTAGRILKLLDEDSAKIKKDPQYLHKKVDQLLLPVIDQQAVAKLILSHHWLQASPDQRQRFMKGFKNMLIRTYSKSIDDYTNVKINYLPKRGQSREGRDVVRTRVITGQGRAPLPVNYLFRRVDDQWKVYDVVIDGLSLVKNFRTSFGNEIEHSSLDALIKRLSQTDASDEEVPDLSGRGSHSAQ